MNTHRAWRPHMDSAPLFNPFVPVTQRNQTADHVELADMDEDEQADAPKDTSVERASAQSPVPK
jgi:hypothetical protein